jgi:hypothetical protein
MFGTYTPDGDIYHDMVGAELPGDTTPTIAVPSRLYYEVTEAQPLAGLRLAVKNIISDMFHISILHRESRFSTEWLCHLKIALRD